MKKTTIAIIISLIVLSLVGCGVGNGNDNLDKEEVIEKSRESFTELNSLHQKTSINLVIDLENNQKTQDIDMETKMIYDESKNIENIYTENVITTDSLVQRIIFYKGPEGMYADQGNGWEAHNAGEDYSTTYEPIFNSFLDIVEEMEMIENDTEYEFNYTGKNGNVFRDVGEPYSINYTGLTDDEIELDITFIIKKDTMLIGQTRIETQGVLDENNKATMNAETEFSELNKIETIEKPAEIENE